MNAVYTSSRQANAARAIAHVAAAGRRQEERLATAAAHAKVWARVQETGQLVTENEEWCYVCGRATDHSGEHTPEQIAAWVAERDRQDALEW